MEKNIRIIVIDEPSGHAVALSNLLGSEGHAVKAESVKDDKDLIELLKQQLWDVIIARPETPLLTNYHALGIVAKHQPELPIIIISDHQDPEKMSALVATGTYQLISLEQPQQALQIILNAVDTTLLKRDLKRCRKQHVALGHRVQLLVDHSKDPISYIHEGEHLYANRAYLELFGYSNMSAVEGMPVTNMVSRDERNHLETLLRNYARGDEKTGSLKLGGLRSDATHFPINIKFSPASFGGKSCIQLTIENLANSEELEDSGSRDLASGLYNRQYFLQNFDAKSVDNARGAILLITVDGYDAVREHMGDSTGDQMVTELAQALEQLLKGSEYLLARYARGQFIVALNDAEQETVAKLSQTILDAVEKMVFALDGKSVTTTCSIGVSFYDEPMENSMDLISRAVKANREAAKIEGNALKIYIPSKKDRAEQEQISILAREIKNSIVHNRLKLFYQPIISLGSDPNENYEILLRMHRGGDKFVKSADFFNAAEHTGLSTAIDRWVVGHAIKSLITNRRKGKKLIFFIKISEATVADPAPFLTWLETIMKAVKIKTGSLVFEIHENFVAKNMSGTKMLQTGLGKMKIRLALDQVGLAADSVNIVRSCNAHYLKLASDLISRLAKEQEARSQVLEITSLAAASNTLVIANSVEDPHTLAAIYTSGIDYIIGYFIQPPGPDMNYDFNS